MCGLSCIIGWGGINMAWGGKNIIKTMCAPTKKWEKERKDKGKEKKSVKIKNDRARTMFHKIMGNLERNAGNRGHNIIFSPMPRYYCILIITLKTEHKNPTGGKYMIFFPRVSLYFPLKPCKNCSTFTDGVLGGKYGNREIKS